MRTIGPLPSPPPNENFALIPIIAASEPRWSQGSRPHPDESTGWYTELGHPPEGQREAVLTTVADAEPQAVVVIPGHSLWPFWPTVACLVVLVAVLFDVWLVTAIGLVGVVGTIASWLWPVAEPTCVRPRETADDAHVLADRPADRRRRQQHRLVGGGPRPDRRRPSRGRRLGRGDLPALTGRDVAADGGDATGPRPSRGSGRGHLLAAALAIAAA
jgi:hypothetical protein